MLALGLRSWLSLATLLIFFSPISTENALAAAQPSFDCSKARSWSEREVCLNEMLAGLDVKLASLYKAKWAQLDGIQKKVLIGDQKQWLQDRGNCNFSPSPSQCLIDIYNKRISELSTVRDNRDESLKQSAAAQITKAAPGMLAEQVPVPVEQKSEPEKATKLRPPIVDVRDLDSNPFPYKGRRVVVPGTWNKMLSETEAYLCPYGYDAWGVVVAGMELSAFRAGANCLVVLEVDGKKVVQGLNPALVTAVTYIDQRCRDPQLRGRATEEVDWKYVAEQLPKSGARFSW